MFKHKRPYEVPHDELMFIDPDSRVKLFCNMLDNYKVFCPGMKLEYAYLNYNSKVPFDYCIVFTTVGTKGERLVAWNCAYLYAWDSIPGYRYAVREGLFKQFFDEETKLMCRIVQSKFNEFIEMMCHLSLKDGESYWKNPEFAETLLDNLSELALRYTPMK